MDAEIKRKWVEALQSGKYKQARDVRKRCADGSYCCLGVLWEVCGPVEWRDVGDIGYRPFRQGRDDDGFYIPSEARIPSYQLLIKLNDGGKSFAEIADYIEKNL